MRIRLVLVGKTERGFVAEGMAHYLERVRHWTSVEETVVSKSDRTTPKSSAWRRNGTC